MSLSSAKAKLDAQGGDPVTGYISKTDHKESYDELVDDTALTGATTAEAVTVSGALVAGTVNGRDPDTLVVGPGSASDNALVRFDGTGGKTVQNSGITVDDSGQIVDSLTVYNASSTGYLDVDSGTPGLYGAYLRFQGAGVNRWAFGRQGATNAYLIHAANASGVYNANYALYIDNATNRFRIDAGATAGLELGSSGPRVMSGTGSPEGVVTAPVGSQWTDTAATTGAIKWIKASGTGNTGWVVEYGDTGWRNLAAESMSNSWTVAGATFGLRRVGQSVFIRAAFGAASASADTVYTLPSGFRSIGNEQWFAPDAAASSGRRCYIASDGTITVASRGASTYFVSVTYTTNDAWPSSLPGT